MVSKQLLLKTLRRLHMSKQANSEKIMFWLLSAGGILVAFLAVYIVLNAYFDQSAASMLPAKTTSLYLEIKDQGLPAKLKNSAIADVLALRPILRILGVEETLIPDWAKKNTGVAMIQGNPVVFFKAQSRRRALKFLNAMTLEVEKLENRGTSQFPIYIYPQGQRFAFAFAGPYLFLAPNASILENIHQVMQGQLEALENDGGFKKAVVNLPKKPWIAGYLDVDSFGNTRADALINPFRQFSSQIGFTVLQKQNGFIFNTFLSLAPELNDMTWQSAEKTSMPLGLSKFIPSEKLAVYFGGADLSSELENTLLALEKLNPAYGILLEGLFRAQVNKIFGTNINLEQDVYPLFEGEYSFTISPRKNGAIGLQLLLTHKNAEKTKVMLKKLSEGFGLLAAQFTPRVRTITLPDGTESRELVSDPESLKIFHETDKNLEIECAEVQATNYGFCYTLTDSLVLLANDMDALRQGIVSIRGKGETLDTFQPFREGLSNLSKVNEEMTFVNFTNIIPLLQKTAIGSLLIPYVEPLDAVTWVKHSFKDGVSTEGFLQIK